MIKIAIMKFLCPSRTGVGLSFYHLLFMTSGFCPVSRFASFAIHESHILGVTAAIDA
jgi:hypothetical protein